MRKILSIRFVKSSPLSLKECSIKRLSSSWILNVRIQNQAYLRTNISSVFGRNNRIVTSSLHSHGLITNHLPRVLCLPRELLSKGSLPEDIMKSNEGASLTICQQASSVIVQESFLRCIRRGTSFRPVIAVRLDRSM